MTDPTTNLSQQPVTYGLIGCGAFGQFCLAQYAAMDGVKLVACADVNPAAAEQAAGAHRGMESTDIETLLTRDDIELVHLATPPSTHHELAIRAMKAGKHVLCEKPLAVTRADADEMVATAEATGRVLAVNLIMRYDPLCEAVANILRDKLLGEPIHAFFENDAKDEPLGPDHWFWDRSKSGGIFIEHGVHFFDLYRYWLGDDARVLTAAQGRRPGNEAIVEQVHCTCRYSGGATDPTLVSFYHGFHQASRLDRQEMRIVCERGDIRLYEWLPTRMEVAVLGDEGVADRLRERVPHATDISTTAYEESERNVVSRHKQYEADALYRIAGHVGMDKPALYGHVLRSLLADQAMAIRNPDHVRRVTEHNGLTSLHLADDAQRLAQSSPSTSQSNVS